ncbi:MAG: hypothetical protein HY680_03760 [Chloroflexi bacterium]|nr:hypothetical protein [Chloroflexota bacterium]
MSTRAASKLLGETLKHVRISLVERGKLPYQGVLGQLAALYGTTPERVIKEATGQEFLDFVGTFLGSSVSASGRTERLEESITGKEKAALQNYLQWLRFQAMVAREDANEADGGSDVSARGARS